MTETNQPFDAAFLDITAVNRSLAAASARPPLPPAPQ
jgi:hypothetical protein